MKECICGQNMHYLSSSGFWYDFHLKRVKKLIIKKKKLQLSSWWKSTVCVCLCVLLNSFQPVTHFFIHWLLNSTSPRSHLSDDQQPAAPSHHRYWCQTSVHVGEERETHADLAEKNKNGWDWRDGVRKSDGENDSEGEELWTEQTAATHGAWLIVKESWAVGSITAGDSQQWKLWQSLRDFFPIREIYTVNFLQLWSHSYSRREWGTNWTKQVHVGEHAFW